MSEGNMKPTVMMIPSWLQKEITNTLQIRSDTTQEKRIKTRQFIFEAISERLWRYKTYAYSVKTKTNPPEESIIPAGRLVDKPNDGGKSLEVKNE